MCVRARNAYLAAGTDEEADDGVAILSCDRRPLEVGRENHVKLKH